MNLLGVDWGEKKIGLAVSEEGWVKPWEVVARIGVIGKIRGICREKKIKKIILGLPEGKLAKKVKKFSQELEEETKIKVEFLDESLTSQDAIARMRGVGVGQKERRTEDAFAAAVLLEGYLERRSDD
jgi:putative Holliday junction resolvase